jgi:hypothetical protein
MNSDQNIRTNLMDVQLYFLKAALLKLGHPLTILPSESGRIEAADVKMTRRLDGSVLLELVEGADPNSSKILLPTGRSPLTLL